MHDNSDADDDEDDVTSDLEESNFIDGQNSDQEDHGSEDMDNDEDDGISEDEDEKQVRRERGRDIAAKYNNDVNEGKTVFVRLSVLFSPPSKTKRVIRS